LRATHFAHSDFWHVSQVLASKDLTLAVFY
jgi:hypothetical protein